MKIQRKVERKANIPPLNIKKLLNSQLNFTFYFQKDSNNDYEGRHKNSQQDKTKACPESVKGWNSEEDRFFPR